MKWLYNKNEINEIADLPQGTFGFIYQTTHVSTGKKYIGKKSLMYNKKKKLTKKELLEYAGKKGRTPTHIRVQKESDWKTYYGSHHLIKEYLKGGFEHELKREIIAIATNKKHLTYLECKHQFALGVLESSEYLNDNILGKFFDRDFN
jgi:hypothetical protein